MICVFVNFTPNISKLFRSVLYIPESKYFLVRVYRLDCKGTTAVNKLAVFCQKMYDSL